MTEVFVMAIFEKRNVKFPYFSNVNFAYLLECLFIRILARLAFEQPVDISNEIEISK